MSDSPINNESRNAMHFMNSNSTSDSVGNDLPPARPAAHDVESCPYFGMYVDLSEASGYPHEKDTMVSPEEYGAALLKDAERYRWVREFGFTLYCNLFNDDEAPSLGLKENAERLDAAIDAALAARGEKAP